MRIKAGVFLLAFALTATSVGVAFAESGRFLSTVGAARPPVGFAAACADYKWLCSTGLRSAPVASVEIRKVAASVNAQVNRTIASRPPAAMKWSLPSAGAGDCVSYALLKLRMLLDAGVPPQRVFIATVQTNSGEDHAVLVVRTDQEDLILDNLRGGLLTWKETGYTFLKLQNASSRSHWDLVLLGPRARRS